MSWYFLFTFLSVSTTIYCINRPVYKIVLTQKGFSQFLQYDIDAPPIREFTFCTWIRLYELDYEQGLFSYVVNGNRVIRLWLETGGHFMKVAINERTPSMVPVDIARDSWKHICLSYQADYGAWALYMDGRLVSCESMQSLHGFVLPAGGSVIIGYGTSTVIPSGIEGEVFGANMILSSTIERNHTLKRDPLYEQKRFFQNRVFGNRNLKYVVLGEMDSKVIRNNFETSKLPPTPKKSKKPLKLPFPYNLSEFSNNLAITSLHSYFLNKPTEKITSDKIVTRTTTGTTEKINFWKLVNQASHETKYSLKTSKKPLDSTENRDVDNKTATLSIWNTLTPGQKSNFSKSLQSKVYPTTKAFYALNEDFTHTNASLNHLKNDKLVSEIMTSLPSKNYFNDIYQKTGTKLVGNVLNYLKKINYYIKEPVKVPVNIPLVKISDNFKNYKDGIKVHQPLKFQRRNFVSRQLDKRQIKKTKRYIKDDLESHITNSTLLNPALEEKVSRNTTPNSKKDKRNYRNIGKKSSIKRQYSEKIYEEKPFTLSRDKIHKNLIHSEESERNNILTILPFIKSLEYIVNGRENNSNEIFSTDMSGNDFTRSLIQGNKWHNVHTYNNDFTPRRVNLESGMLDKNDISDVNKKHPSVRLKFKPDIHKFITGHKDTSIIKGRALAREVSNQSNHDSFSILKYNRGFLPKHRRDEKSSGRVNRISKLNRKHDSTSEGNNKKNKSPSALKQSLLNEDFNNRRLSGDDNIITGMGKPKPTQSEGDKINDTTPLRYGLRACIALKSEDHNLYVQPDGSIDLTHIVSPVKDKNIGIEFIMQNYKRCSLKDSSLEKNPFLFIDWNKTPVRLFGGAYPKKTTDLCGFF